MDSTEVVASRLLESLPTRPPTPPRETNHDPDAPLKQALLGGRTPLDPRSSLQTPPSAHSPPSVSKSSTGSSRLKKVEFSAKAEYKEPPVYAAETGSNTATAGQTPPPVALPPSSTSSRPAKSILKVTAYETARSDEPVQLADMLASTVQQLAGADRDSKLDAYMMLARALKASDNLPDRIALQSKMSLFTHFIQRDITGARTPAGAPDSALILAALDLLNTFLRFSAIASTLSSDFGVFIIDHCIRTFEVADGPRDILRTLMRVVALQSFPAKVMTADRVGRLVASLHNMDEQMESKNTVLLRSIIYRTLVKDHRLQMVMHLDWLPDLFTDMLSSVPYIRDAAIGLGLDAGFTLGRERPAAQRVVELFQTTVDNVKYFEYYAERLTAMTKSKADSPSVPQVWSVVTLFLRSPEKWDFFMPWLRIIQGCFNCSDHRTKEEANFAWSRFAYALQRDNRPLTKKMLTVLNQALVSQLRRRRTAGKHADDLRRVVLGSVGNLFYYAFRPGTEPKQLDNVWDNGVRPVVLQLLETPAVEEAKERQKANQAYACALLTGLLDCTTVRPWSEDHIVKHPTVLPEDLHSIDAKWIRRNSDRVFALVEPILQRHFLDLSTPRSATQTLWRTVVGAVAVAAAKEVKVSTETAVFVGHALSLLLKLWTAGYPALVPGAMQGENPEAADTSFAATQFLAATREFLLTMVDSLGPLPFTEKQLSKDEGNSFIPVATPSQRAGKGHHGLARTPLHHIFSILSSLPPGVQDNDDFSDFVEQVFAPFFSAKSAKGRRSLALEMLQMTPMDALCPYGPWVVVASRIASSMDQLSSGSISGSGVVSSSGSTSLGGSNKNLNRYENQHLHSMSSGSAAGDGANPVGHEFREVVRVLERGLRSTPKLPWPRWQALFCTLSDRVREDAGEAGLAICVLDPLAKAIADLCAHPSFSALSPTTSRAIVELVSQASQPRDRQAVDAAKRRLWGSAIAASGPSTPFDPFDHLYKLVNATLLQEYNNCEDSNASESAPLLLKELAGFFTRCNEQLFTKALVAVQDGLACWIRDDNMRLSRQSPIGEAVTTVWDGLCPLLERANESNTLQLKALEPLLCAAFSSKHRYIVNNALSMWTTIFGGHVGEIDYPAKLKAALLTIQPFIDIVIPGLDVSMESEGAQQQPIFVDSQEEDLGAFIDLSSTSNSNNRAITTPRPTSSYQARSPFAAIPLTLSGKRPQSAPMVPLAMTTPSSVNSVSNSKKSKRDKAAGPRPRPRHEDSQIEFTTIGSASPGQSNNLDGSRVEESQVLTDRQREVRDRQRETDALYSDIMTSSPGAVVAEVAAKKPTPQPAVLLLSSPSRQLLETEQQMSQSEQPEQLEQPELLEPVAQEEQLSSSPGPEVPEDIMLPQQRRAATPEAAPVMTAAANSSNFVDDDDFIASTPTPRRGQALVLPAVNDTDPPSSPPEPRRYPLMPEMTSRSRSSSILDEWQFSSSPLSGSPIAARHTMPEPELSLEGAVVPSQDENSERAQKSTQEGIQEDIQEDVLGDAVPDTGAEQDELPQPELPQLPISQLSTVSDANSTAEMEMADIPRSSSLVNGVSPTRKRRARDVRPSTPKLTRQRSRASSQETPKSSSQREHETMRTLRNRFTNTTAASVAGSQRRSAKGSTRSSPIRSSTSNGNSFIGSGRRIRTSRKAAALAAATAAAASLSSNPDLSFFISEGDERSMLRLAVELDNRKAQSSPITKTPVSYRDEEEDVEILDCITVWTGDLGDGDDNGDELPSSQESQANSLQSPSSGKRRSRRGRKSKRKRGAAEVACADDEPAVSSPLEGRRNRRRSPPKRQKVEETLEAQPKAASVSPSKQFAASTGALVAGADVVEPSSTESVDDASAAPVFDDEQVQSQLATEQMEQLAHEGVAATSTAEEPESVEEVVADKVTEPAAVQDVIQDVVDLTNMPESMEDDLQVVDEDETQSQPEQGVQEVQAEPAQPQLSDILSMLKGSLSLLNSATLSRDDVSAIEDVCMDVKRALYDAERRGRD